MKYDLRFPARDWRDRSTEVKDLLMHMLMVDPSKRITAKQVRGDEMKEAHACLPTPPFDSDNGCKATVPNLNRSSLCTPGKGAPLDSPQRPGSHAVVCSAVSIVGASGGWPYGLQVVGGC